MLRWSVIFRRMRRRVLLLVAAASIPRMLTAQLTAGLVEGILGGPDGRPMAGATILVTDRLGFRAEIHTGPDGAFAVTLGYGLYRFSAGGAKGEVTVPVAPLQTARLYLAIEASGILRRADEAANRPPEVYSDKTRARSYPEAFSLPGALLSREAASVTEPLDFTGLSDNRLAIDSQRGYSWTSVQYNFLGMDATDSYQPGNPMILPNVEALDDAVVRNGFAQTTSSSYGPEISLFPVQPGESWHGTLATANTDSLFASSNLPPASDRGIVQQAEYFRWFTRDSFQVTGPLTKHADISATGTAQWSSQTVPLAPPGNNQRSRLLFGDVRGRFEAGPGDQFDALYSGARINLQNWGVPQGLEELSGNPMSPPLVLPGGYSGESGTDHLDFLQAGWTHHWSSAPALGVLQVRYGDSSAHVSTDPPATVFGAAESKIELLGGMVTGAPPISDLAVRTRQDVEGAWQPAVWRAGKFRHQIAVGGGWTTSEPLNRLTIPSDINLITLNGAPTFVVEFNTPLGSRAIVRSSSSYVADHMQLTRGLSLDLGVLANLSRGSLPAQTKPDGQFVHAESFAAAPDLIVWNNLSPRAGFAWQIPDFQRLVFRGAYARLDAPLAGRYLDFGNPDSLSGNVYQWIDRNSDGQFQLGEEGTLLSRFGGAYSSISPSLQRPYSDEYNLGAELALARATFLKVGLFRRDDKDRIAAVDTGVPAQAYTPVTILDPSDNRHLVVYQQNPATFGQDTYLLTNPAGLRTLNSGAVAELETRWRAVTLHASFVAEKSYGPANPGDAFFENDPGVVGALYSNPNTLIDAARRSFTDRAFVGKIWGDYRLPSAWGGLEITGVADYVGGLQFAQELLVTGLAQGPFLVTTGMNRAQYILNSNLRILREFRLPYGRLAPSVDILNVPNAGHTVQETDFIGPTGNVRTPVAIQEPRAVRLQLRYDF
jgi:hypothetical protein